MIKKKPHTAKGILVVRNDRGIHTRPATEIVKCAVGFKSDIKLKYQKSEVNARSLLGILTLAACKGARINVEATGADADKAVKMILELAQNNFNIQY